MFNHTGENGFHCGVCELVFNRKSRLEKHVKQVHQTDDETAVDELICDICQETFPGKDALRRHKTSHSEAFSKFKLLKHDFRNTNCNYTFQNLNAIIVMKHSHPNLNWQYTKSRTKSIVYATYVTKHVLGRTILFDI